MRKQALKALIVVGLAAAGVAAKAPTIDAHAPNVWRDCSGLHVTFTNYEGGDTNNVLGVHIVNGDNSSSYMTTTFGSNYSNVFTWSQSHSHSYTVTVDANVHTGDPVKYDITFTGSIQACVAPTTTTIAATTTTTIAMDTDAPTTTAVAVDQPPVPCPYNQNIPASDPACVADTVVVIDDGVIAVASTVSPTGSASGLGTNDPGLPVTGGNLGGLALAAALVLGGIGAVLVTRRSAPTG